MDSILIGLNGQEIPAGANIVIDGRYAQRWYVEARFDAAGTGNIVPLGRYEDERTAEMWRACFAASLAI